MPVPVIILEAFPTEVVVIPLTLPLKINTILDFERNGKIHFYKNSIFLNEKDYTIKYCFSVN